MSEDALLERYCAERIFGALSDDEKKELCMRKITTAMDSYDFSSRVDAKITERIEEILDNQLNDELVKIDINNKVSEAVKVITTDSDIIQEWINHRILKKAVKKYFKK